MVRFVVVGTEDEARTFLEALCDIRPEESERVVSVARCKVKVPARVFQDTFPAPQGKTSVTLTFTPKTGGVQVQTAAAMEDDMMEKVKALEKIFVQWSRSGDREAFAQIVGVPPGAASAVLSFRGAMRHVLLEKSTKVDQEIPTDKAYTEAIREIGGMAHARLEAYPSVQAKLLKVMALDFGLLQGDEGGFMDEAVLLGADQPIVHQG